MLIKVACSNSAWRAKGSSPFVLRQACSGAAEGSQREPDIAPVIRKVPRGFFRIRL